MLASSPEEFDKIASQQSTLAPAPPLGQYSEGFDFKDPIELLVLLDEDVSSGRIKLHKWQVQFLMDFASKDFTDMSPFQAVVRACNGSGKDKYIIAPCAVWLCMRYKQARCVVTSSSGVQLDNQTDTYINQLCQAANAKIHPGIWKINYRYYECLATGSPMLLFATDEAGKAEGYHPLVAGGKMAILVSEDKTVPDEINTALNRCTGYTHRCHVSTPGLPMGHFFNYCSVAISRTDVKDIGQVKPTDFIHYHITAYDCSHLSRNYIEQCKRDLPGGEGGAVFRSQVLAEFGTTDEQVVIPYTYIWRAKNVAPKIGWLAEDHNTGGLDLAAGGDETVLAIRNGNKLLKVIPFKFDNTQDSVNFLEEKFREHGLVNPDARVWADAGGLGKPIIDLLRARGWVNIRYVINQSKPYDERVYINRGTEMWFWFGKLLERSEIWFAVDDERLIRQLSTRYYKITDKNKHQLESKLQARSKGHPSPDRADAVVLCFSNYKSKLEDLSVVPEEERPFKLPDLPPNKPIFTLKEWSQKESNDPLAGFNMIRKPKDIKRLQALISEHNSKIKV